MGCSVEKMTRVSNLDTPRDKKALLDKKSIISHDDLLSPKQNINDNVSNQDSSTGILDPRLPLNRREIFLLNKSWKGISRNMDIAGVKMFTKIFLKNPELLVLFRHINVQKEDHQNVEAYENSMELETHSEIVMNTIDEAISCFADYDKCHQILSSIGSFHCTIRNFKGEYFLKARDPFLQAVAEVLGDRNSENMQSIYKRAIDFILNTLCEGWKSGIELNKPKYLTTP
ncbi:unnamed protein product [Gordionus sp. m RMFG-2023]